MRTEYRLWQWPTLNCCGESQGLYPTTVAAMAAANRPTEDWKPGKASTLGAGGLWINDQNERWGITPEDVPETDIDRIRLAVEILLENGQFDGGHHKMWVIDQALRVLAGNDYEQIVQDYCHGEDGPDTYAWDEGIAP